MNEQTKSKILLKAQKNQQDPGKTNNYRLLGGWSYSVGMILCVFIIFIRAYTSKEFITDGALILFGMYTFFFWGSYFKNEKRKNDLFFAFSSTIIFLVLLILFLIQVI